MSDNPKLKEGKWWIGRGTDIPLSHQAWLPPTNQALNRDNNRIQPETVADLINQDTCTWKYDMASGLYPYPLCNEVLSCPISKTGSVTDELLWKYSSSGEFQVHKAYYVLQDDYQASRQDHQGNRPIQQEIWKLLC